MEFSLFAWLLHMHVQDHLCSPHFSARLRVPKLTWHNQKGIIIVNLSTYIFMIAFNSTYSYLIVCYAHMKIILLYMHNILSFIFIIIDFIVIYFAAWLRKWKAVSVTLGIGRLSQVPVLIRNEIHSKLILYLIFSKYFIQKPILLSFSLLIL